MFCTKCGAVLNDGAKFCSKCGNRISAGNQERPRIVNRENVPENTRTGSQYEGPENFGKLSPYEGPDNIGKSSPYEGADNTGRAYEYERQDTARRNPEYERRDNPGSNYRHERYVDDRDYRPYHQKEKNKTGAVSAIIAVLTLCIIAGIGTAAYLTGRLNSFLPAGLQYENSSGTAKEGDVSDSSKASLETLGDSEKENSEKEASEKETPVSSDSDKENKTASWNDYYLEEVKTLSKDQYTSFSFFDIDSDGIMELICRNSANDTYRLYTFKEATGGNMVEIVGDSVLTYNQPLKQFGFSFSQDTSSFDTFFEIKDGKFSSVFTGELRQSMSKVMDDYGYPYMSAWASDENISVDDYYRTISDYYKGELTDDGKLPYVGYDDMVGILESSDPGTAFSQKSKTDNIMYSQTFEYKESVQFFVAPLNGTYSFTLYGANGGGDAFRDYDEEASILSGTINLKAGEKVAILTGGAGGITTAQEGIVAGGFNGGGCGYWSGGGGGCTDIFYNGTRVAAAAGSGGGNYEAQGKAGRTSGDGSNITGSKFGGESPKVDCGGGGGGWFGGVSPNVEDKAGFGGVNGWDDNFFTMMWEKTGTAYSESGSRNGSVEVEFIK